MSVIIKSGNSSAVATVQPDGSLLTSTKSLDASITGSISFIDAIVPAPANNGQMVSGASTPGSLVALEVEGLSSWTATLTSGVFTTSIYFEGSSDSTNGTDGNWISLFGRVLGNAGDTNSYFTTTNNQLIEGSCGGLFFIRLRAVGGAISSPVSVVLQAGAVNTISIGTPLPAGTNAIGHVLVDNFPATQPVSISGTVPISAASLPLPAGAATSANQATEIASLSSIDGKTPALVSGRQPVDGSGVTQPISAVTLPLPTGASTSALQTTGNASLASIDTKTPALVSGRQPVDGSGVTQPVSGTFFQSTQPISAATLPLPTGAATAAKQPAIGTAGTASADVITVQGIASMTALKVDGSAVTQPVSATTLPLPTGAATDASLTNGTAKTQTVSGTGTVQDVNAKAVQGANFAAVQQPKDSGRVAKVYSGSFTATAAEAMVTLTPISDGVAGTPATSFTVTAGKRFRIQAMLLTVFNVTAAIHAVQTNLRMTSSGAVTGSSPLVGTCGAATAAATTGLAASAIVAGIPDGLELSGTMQFGISNIGIALPGQTVVLIGYEY